MKKAGRPKKPKYKLELANNWLDVKEKDKANKLFNDFLNNNHFDVESDIQLLRRLVFAIINSQRIEEELTAQFKAGKENPKRAKVNTFLNKVYSAGLNEIVEIEKHLGMLGDKNRVNPLKFIFSLFEKARRWREENIEGRSIVCPFCQKMFFLQIRTDKYKAIKHPFIFGKTKILFNEELWKLYINKKITKKEIANILNTSEFYIEWIEEQMDKFGGLEIFKTKNE